ALPAGPGAAPPAAYGAQPLRLLPLLPRDPEIPDPRDGPPSRARPAAGREPGDPPDPHRHLPPGPRDPRDLRADGRSRRGGPGVALPARQDGRADDRHPARHGRLRGRRVPEDDSHETALPQPLGDPAGPLAARVSPPPETRAKLA